MIEDEYRRTVEVVLHLTGDREVAERFPQFRRRLTRRLPTLNQVSRQQIELLRRFRAAEGGKAPDEYLGPLLLSINCIAAGFGTTG